MQRGFFKGLLVGCMTSVIVLGGAILLRDYRIQHMNTANSSEENEINAYTLLDDNRFRVKYNDIVSRLDNYYLNKEDIDPDKIIDGMCQGIVDSLGDRYADYYTPEEYKEFNEQFEGQYGGIGAYVSQNAETGAILIVKPFDGSPAEKAGLLAGDIILEIDGVTVLDKTLDEAVSLMRGEVGTSIPVKIRRDDKDIELMVSREIIDVPTVSYRVLEDCNIGYIYISTFDAVTITQFSDAVDDIESRGADGLIVDVRDNGGGRLDAVVAMLNRILPDGMIMYTETRDGVDKEYTADSKQSYNKPMAVLINEYSASASEVFAGAVQDRKVATLVGNKSFGKGVVQSLYQLNGAHDGSAIKITTAKYYTPSGRNIDGIGITPDVEVEFDPDKSVKQGDTTIDNQLQKAIDIVKEQIR